MTVQNKQYELSKITKEIVISQPFYGLLLLNINKLFTNCGTARAVLRGINYSLEFDLPGLKKEDIDIKLDGQLLTIRGTREEKHKTQGRNFYTKERSYGEFMRSITLPSNVKSDSIDASFQDGVLHITLQKHQGDSVKKINIK
jgi:HSP20 family protein